MDMKRVIQGLGAVMVVSLVATRACALPISQISAAGLAPATAAEAAFLGGLTDRVTEGFDSFTAPLQSQTITTSVGVFSQSLAGGVNGGGCAGFASGCSGGIAVLNESESPFSGRFAVSMNNWLDSADAQQIRFELKNTSTSVGFYLTDPNDVNGVLDLVLTDGNNQQTTLSNLMGGSKLNGSAHYVSLYNPLGIKRIIFNANSLNDGFGIDHVTIGSVVVPEPGTLALMGLGLLAIGYMVFRRNKS